MAGDLLPLVIPTDATMEQFYHEVQSQLFPDTTCLTHLLLHRHVDVLEEQEEEKQEEKEKEKQEEEFLPIPIASEALCPLEDEIFFVLVNSSTLPYHDSFLGVFPYDVHASHDGVDITAIVRTNHDEPTPSYLTKRYRVVELAFYDQTTDRDICCHVHDYAVCMPSTTQPVGEIYPMELFHDMEVTHTYQDNVPRQGHVFARSRIAPLPQQALSYRDLVPHHILTHPYFHTHTFYRVLALVKRIQKTMAYFMDL